MSSEPLEVVVDPWLQFLVVVVDADALLLLRSCWRTPRLLALLPAVEDDVDDAVDSNFGANWSWFLAFPG